MDVTWGAMLGVGLFAVFAGVYFWSLSEAGRTPGRWAHLYNERIWLRVMAWTVVLSIAGLFGVWLAGGGEFGSVIVVISVVILSIAGEFRASARMNRFFRDFFDR